MKKILPVIIIILILVGLGLWHAKDSAKTQTPIPAENIGNQVEKQDLIRVTTPRPNDVIKSPLTIKGQARGTWFFEASFPIELTNEHGAVIAQGHAEAQADPATGEVSWMTTEFVPFEATLTFTTPTNSTKGNLTLRKDNPSGLPENEDNLQIPISF